MHAQCSMIGKESNTLPIACTLHSQYKGLGFSLSGGLETEQSTEIVMYE